MPRAIWKGTLGFGLVTIGVELHSAEAPDELDLDLLDKRNHARIRYQKINEATGKPVAKEDIVKGVAVSKGRYVELSDADLKAANPKSTQSIDILGFVPREAVELIYFAKPYYVAPLKGNEKAYVLLREALRKRRQMAVAQVVVRTRQHVAAVYPYESALVVHLLRYHNEIKDAKSLGVPDEKSLTRSLKPAELAMAGQLMESMTAEWNPEEFSDTYRRDLLKLVKQRSAKGAKAAKAPAPREEPAETGVLDLMAALKRSVESGGKRAKATRATPRSRPGTRQRSAARKSA